MNKKLTTTLIRFQIIIIPLAHHSFIFDRSLFQFLSLDSIDFKKWKKV